MQCNRIKEVATVVKFGLCTKIHIMRLFLLFTAISTMGTIAHRAAAGIGGMGGDTFVYAWSLPNQTGETAYGMQWLLESYSISNINNVLDLSGGYPHSDLVYSDPMWDNRVIWTGTSTAPGESAWFGLETKTELWDFTGNWLDEAETHPLAPTFEFSPPNWEYISAIGEYSVRTENTTESPYWIQRRMSYLHDPLQLDGARAADKLLDQSQIIDASPRLLPSNSGESLELRMVAEQGVVGFLLAYDLYADEGANPGRYLGRFINALSLTDESPGSGLIDGDFDRDGDVDGRDFLEIQRGKSSGLSFEKAIGMWNENYGRGGELKGYVTSVPEPMSGVMLVLGIAAIFATRSCTRGI